MQRSCSLSVRTPLQPSVRTRASRGASGTTAQRCPQRTVAGRSLRLACSAAAAADPVPVMVNGITGKMGFATAEAAVQRGMRLLPVAFSGALLPRRSLAARQLTRSVRAATRAGQSVTCLGERIDLQPFGDDAMKQLLQRFPVRPCELSRHSALSMALTRARCRGSWWWTTRTRQQCTPMHRCAPTLRPRKPSLMCSVVISSMRATACRSSWAPRGETARSWCAFTLTPRACGFSRIGCRRRRKFCKRVRMLSSRLRWESSSSLFRCVCVVCMNSCLC